MLKEQIDAFFDSKTPEEIEEIKKKYFTEPKVPKGWVSIEDHLPQFRAIDLLKGGSVYKIRYKDGSEDATKVSDHNLWYKLAKDAGVTHWYND